MLKDKKKQINFSRVRIVFIDCFILYGIDIKKKKPDIFSECRPADVLEGKSERYIGYGVFSEHTDRSSKRRF